MIKQINLFKKEQRVLMVAKREVLKNKIKIDNQFFKNKLLTFQAFKDSKIIASFLSIKSEISTDFINELVESEGKILCLPVILNDVDQGLIFKCYSKGEKLVEGKFNVKEPQNSKIYLPEVIFTPCLAFDLDGYRLGYGGGFYDKTISYLEGINHKFITIGIAYDDQKVKKVIRNNFDKKLNYILTEKQLYKIL